MQRLFVHRAVFDRVNGARFGARPFFEAALEHVDDRRLTAADWSHQQQDAFAHFKTLGRGLEVLDDSGDRLFDAE